MISAPPAEAKEVPAVSEEETKTAPDSEPEDSQEHKPERGEDGKFKSKDAKDDAKEDDGEDVPKGVQKRIDKAVKAQREAERRAEEAERKARELEAAKPKAEPEKKPEPAADAKRPKPENFKTYDEYVEALTDWKADERDRARDEKARKEREAEDGKRRAAEWKTRREAALEKHPDFEEVVAGATDVPITQAMHSTVIESDIGPELIYYFASNKAEAERIAKLSPLGQAREIGKIEAALVKTAEAPEPKEPAKKKLPKPAATVGGAASAKVQKLDDPSLDLSTFKRLAIAGLRKSS